MIPTNHDWIYQLYVEELNKKKLLPADFYDEDGKRVMTESYHKKRGSCCGSGCRHCPYEPKHTRGVTDIFIKKQH